MKLNKAILYSEILLWVIAITGCVLLFLDLMGIGNVGYDCILLIYGLELLVLTVYISLIIVEDYRTEE